MKKRKTGHTAMLKNPCKECVYYHKENNTCQSKKCATGDPGYVSIFDRLFCEPYRGRADALYHCDPEKGA